MVETWRLQSQNLVIAANVTMEIGQSNPLEWSPACWLTHMWLKTELKWLGHLHSPPHLPPRLYVHPVFWRLTAARGQPVLGSIRFSRLISLKPFSVLLSLFRIVLLMILLTSNRPQRIYRVYTPLQICMPRWALAEEAFQPQTQFRSLYILCTFHKCHANMCHANVV